MHGHRLYSLRHMGVRQVEYMLTSYSTKAGKRRCVDDKRKEVG
jgi:hypothetical protein